MKKSLAIIVSVVALALVPYELALGGGGNVDPGGARTISRATAQGLCEGIGTSGPKLCTRCGGLLGPGKCYVIGCRGSWCKYVVMPRGTTRAARVHLSDCIKGWDSCTTACAASHLGLTGEYPTDYEYKQCQNGCWGNHSACVDKALDLR